MNIPKIQKQFDIGIWVVDIVYFLVFSGVRYGRDLKPSTIWFFLGAVIAYPAISIIDAFFRLKKSLFYTVYFQLLLFVVTLFTLTSTAQPFGKGFVLSLLFSTLIAQGKELLKTKGLSSWFAPSDSPLQKEYQSYYFFAVVMVFTILTVYLA